MTGMRRITPIIAGVPLLLSACAYNQKPITAGIATPRSWHATRDNTARIWPSPEWWRGFNSPELDRLIVQAGRNNLDLGAAAARSGIIGKRGGSDFAVNLGASYEVDFWGRNSASVAAARAAVEASRYDQATVALTVTTDVADAYLQVLSDREQLTIARLNLANALQVLDVVNSRLQAGVVSRLDLAQQETLVAAQRAAIPPLRQQQQAALNTLAILLGRPPQGFTVTARDLNGVTPPAVAPGMPSGLLARRPDIQSAEAQLAAADASIAAARAALFPAVNLTASTGFENTALDSLFSTNPLYSLAAAMAAPIFEGGRLRGQVDLAVARRRELLKDYQSAIISGFSDVETALSSIDNLNRQIAFQDQQLQQAETAYRLARCNTRREPWTC